MAQKKNKKRNACKKKRIVQKMTATDEENVSKNSYDSQRFGWYWALIFCGTWFLLFYAAAIPSYYAYPNKIYIDDEAKHPDEFIGERAENTLKQLTDIGPKVAGSEANEVQTVNFLLQQFDKINASARLDLYNLEVDVQHPYGELVLGTLSYVYRHYTNIIVKISPKENESETYLLVNSHFDSAVESSAAGDDGVMVAIMLEVLRVISISEKKLENPIIFLFNGAEEVRLLGSHGFVTEHKWAKNCKAVINLDSAGSGGREILFQSGPNHPWLLKYYHKSVPHPYANTVAEELFQYNFIPSDTDFHIFRDYAHIPGLDMAHTLNGYVYHTKYDIFDNIEHGTYQTTGENLLALIRALANAKELKNTEAYAEGHRVYFDYLGWFMISYTETVGIIINGIIAVAAIIVIGGSLFLMNKSSEDKKSRGIYRHFLLILLTHIIAIAVGIGLTLSVTYILEETGSTLSWFTENWLLFGLYFCPLFFGITIIQAVFLKIIEKKTNILLDETIVCFMHAHCLILAVICLALTFLGLRSAYFITIALLFYLIPPPLTCLFKLVSNINSYWLIHLVFQIFPYWFYTYMTYALLVMLIPMQGRYGPTFATEKFISIFCILMTLLFSGFILPILHKFQKSKTCISIFAVLSIIFIIIAVTPAGFPFKAEETPQRYSVLHMGRIMHNKEGEIRKNDSGYFITPLDARYKDLDETVFKDAVNMSWFEKECTEELVCGLPISSANYAYLSNTRYILADMPNIPTETELQLISKNEIEETSNIFNYTFSLKSSDQLIINIDVDSPIKEWSFANTILEKRKPPYAIFVYSATDDSPYEFWFTKEEVQKEQENETEHGTNVQIAIMANFVYHSAAYTDQFRDFLKTFPAWTFPGSLISIFESWEF